MNFMVGVRDLPTAWAICRLVYIMYIHSTVLRPKLLLLLLLLLLTAIQLSLGGSTIVQTFS